MNLRLMDPAALRARVTGRSYWQARYSDGRVISEWERDWTALDKRGMVDVRLVCPNGQIAGFGNTVEAGDRLFQLKVAMVTAGFGRGTLAHLIGLMNGTDGQCVCFAWDYQQGRLIGPFQDNANQMLYHQIGAISGPHLGVKPD